MGQSLETSRLELHRKLESIESIKKAYFQPPESIKLQYPCIIYDLYRLSQRFADNTAYRKLPCYSVTIIDREQNIDWISIMLDTFEYCSLDRVYNSDELAHYVFTLYYL